MVSDINVKKLIKSMESQRYDQDFHKIEFDALGAIKQLQKERDELRAKLKIAESLIDFELTIEYENRVNELTTHKV